MLFVLPFIDHREAESSASGVTRPPRLAMRRDLDYGSQDESTKFEFPGISTASLPQVLHPGHCCEHRAGLCPPWALETFFPKHPHSVPLKALFPFLLDYVLFISLDISNKELCIGAGDDFEDYLPPPSLKQEKAINFPRAKEPATFNLGIERAPFSLLVNGECLPIKTGR